VCVCERERESERARVNVCERQSMCLCQCVCPPILLFVSARSMYYGASMGVSGLSLYASIHNNYLYVCACVRLRVRERVLGLDM
jgi:hypothetical protein